MIASVAAPCSGARLSTRGARVSSTASRPVRPVVSVRGLGQNQKEGDDRDIHHAERDHLKEVVKESSDLKEARRKLYGREGDEGGRKVMDGAAEVGETVIDKVSGKKHPSKGHDSNPSAPHP